MNLLKFTKYLLGLAMILFLKIPGLLWLLGAAVLFGGALFLARRVQQHRSVVPVAVWTAVVAGALFVLAWQLPDIRLFDLLYL